MSKSYLRKIAFEMSLEDAKNLIKKITSKKSVDGRTIKKFKNDLEKIKQYPKLEKYVDMLKSVLNVNAPTVKITSKHIKEGLKQFQPIVNTSDTYFITDIYGRQIECADFVEYKSPETTIKEIFNSDTQQIETIKLFTAPKFWAPYPYFCNRDQSNIAINKILKINKSNGKNIMFTHYMNGSSPDYTFKLAETTYNLTAKFSNTGNNKQTKKIKEQFIHIITSLIGSGDDVITGKLEASLDYSPEKYNHQLRNGNFNCVLDCIKAQKTKIDTNDERIINSLNEKYFESGVSFSDLIPISKILKIEIDVYSKLNSVIYSTKIKDYKRQIIKIQVENLDHATTYDELIKKSDKEVVYVNDVNEAYKNNKSNLLMFKSEGKDIKYFWDNTTLYKNKSCEDYDLNKYYINNKIELMNYQFENFNNLSSNNIYKNDDVELFKFINRSVHHVFETYFKENIDIIQKVDHGLDFGLDDISDDISSTHREIVDLSNYYAYDRNKHYVSFENNSYYKKHLIPASGKFNFYKVVEPLTETDLKELIKKAGFCQINNIEINNKCIGNLNYFIDNYIYPMPVIEWLMNNNFKFNIVAVAFNNWRQELIFTEEMKKTKEFYTKFIGCMSINNETTSYNLKCGSIIEYQDLKFREPQKVRYYDDNTSSIVIEEKNENVFNKSHISSYILSYAMIEILDKLTQIKYNDLIGVKVDCVIVKKPYDIFNLSNNYGDYKLEVKGEKDLSLTADFINFKSDDELIFNFEHILTNHKLFYKAINFISGMAGSGKTSRFYKKFTNQDERLNCVFGFPNNNLCGKFKNEGNDNIKAFTYHKIFNIGSFDEEYIASKYINVILDEATMIGCSNVEQIVKYAYENKINLFFVGDYSITEQKLYQMEPVNDKSFLDYNFDYSKCFYLPLKTNYRQGSDIPFTELLINGRGKTNNELLKNAIVSNMFKTIKYSEMINEYTLNDIIISPVINGGNVDARTTKINNNILDKHDVVNCKFDGPSMYLKKFYVNAEDIKLSKDEYLKNTKKFKMSYCLTSHLVQGLEYTTDKKIYVLKTKFFTNNQLYVILSRAKESKQIIFVEL